jgi:hypothetical protein
MKLTDTSFSIQGAILHAQGRNKLKGIQMRRKCLGLFRGRATIYQKCLTL